MFHRHPLKRSIIYHFVATILSLLSLLITVTARYIHVRNTRLFVFAAAFYLRFSHRPHRRKLLIRSLLLNQRTAAGAADTRWYGTRRINKGIMYTDKRVLSYEVFSRGIVVVVVVVVVVVIVVKVAVANVKQKGQIIPKFGWCDS